MLLDILLRLFFYGTGLFFLLLSGPLLVKLTSQVNMSEDWKTANRDSAHIAPDAHITSEAIVQVYAARAFNWRGFFSVHCWVSVKPKNAQEWTVYQIVGWYRYYQQPVLRVEVSSPDRYWYGNKPELLVDIRGEKAEAAIPKVQHYTDVYPYKEKYVIWPGPNSNSYIAYLGRHIPELRLNLPATAVGKNFLVKNFLLAKAPSGTGYEFSIHGLLGITLAEIEGLQFNFMGLSFGISWHDGLALNWPGVGRISIF